MLLFSLDSDDLLGARLAQALSVSLAPHEDRAFDDGEHKWRPLVDRRVVFAPVVGYAGYLERQFNAGEANQGAVAWVLAAVPIAVRAFRSNCRHRPRGHRVQPRSSSRRPERWLAASPETETCE